MPAIKAVTVFGGAASGQDPAYRRAALALGEGLAQAGITVIYGGGGDMDDEVPADNTQLPEPVSGYDDGRLRGATSPHCERSARSTTRTCARTASSRCSPR